MASAREKLPLVLFWPTGSIVAKQGESLQGGFVIGWDDARIYEKSSLVDSSLQSRCCARVKVCAAILSFSDLEKRMDFPEFENVVQRAITKISEQYKPENRANAKAKSWSECLCGSLKIVGIWCPRQSELISQSALPVLVPTRFGPWFNESKVCAGSQLLLYDPKGRFRHRHDMPRGAPSFDPSTVSRFQMTLLRLNESRRLAQSIRKEVEGRHPTSGQSAGTSRRRQGRTDDVTDRNYDKSPTYSTLDQFTFHVSSQSLFAKHLDLVHSFNQNDEKRSTSLTAAGLPLDSLPVFRTIAGIKKLIVNTDGEIKMSFPAEIASQGYIDSVSYLACAILDGTLGQVAGLVVYYNRDNFLGYMAATWKYFNNQILRDNVGWLETFPVGFKLNVPLTKNMGGKINRLLAAYDWLSVHLMTTSAKSLLVKLIGVACLVFGLSSVLALAFDVLRLATFHVTIIAECFQKIHRAQICLLSALWRLFRGKKKNVLRDRTDTMEYDSIQLLLGVILFAIVLFMFTTVLVYYVFFTVLNLIVSLALVFVWSLYMTVMLFPAGKLVVRFRFPEWFTTDVFVDDIVSVEELHDLLGLDYIRRDSYVRGNDSCNRSCAKIVPVTQPFTGILAEALCWPFVDLARRLPAFMVEVMTGSPCTVLAACRSMVDNISYNRKS